MLSCDPLRQADGENSLSMQPFSNARPGLQAGLCEVPGHWAQQPGSEVQSLLSDPPPPRPPCLPSSHFRGLGHIYTLLLGLEMTLWAGDWLGGIIGLGAVPS